MKVQRPGIAASLILLTLIGAASALLRQQSAQDTKAAVNQSVPVLSEKNQMISPSSLSAAPAVIRAEDVLDQHDAGLPRSFVSAATSFERTLVEGAPFSAELVIETVQPLRDRTNTMRRLTSMIYRDGEGRTRRDRMPEQIGSGAIGGNQPHVSVINDPIASFTYVLEHRVNLARRMPLLERPDFNSEGPAPVRESTAQGVRRETALATRERGGGSRVSRQGDGVASSSSVTKKKALGQREIEGVMTEGTRLTRVIAAGAFGSNAPIEIVAERWYSDELQVVVLIKRHDPRFGESVYNLKNIKRGEVSRSLFEVPSGYKIKDDDAQYSSRRD